MSLPLIRASQIEPFRAAVRAAGEPTEPLARRLGLSSDRIKGNPNALISEFAVWAFADLCAAALDHDTFGFGVGIETPVEAIGALGEQIGSAPTLRHALDVFLTEVTRHSSHAHFSVVRDESALWFCRHGIDGIDVGEWQVEQYVVGLMVRVVRQALGDHWRPASVRLKQPRLEGLTLPPLLEGCNVTPGCAVTAIELPEDALDEQGRAASTVVPRPAIGRIDMAFVDSLRVALEALLPSGDATLKRVASLVGASSRSIQRWLRQEGQTYALVVDDVRRESALELIRNPHVPIGEIGERLGYTEAANFTRAFRRWTGMPPSTARRRFGSSGP
ncbi:MAG: AraC family transcriptional regulator ligand-binding domain-containing protein [Planctomycetota bacterium]|nr:AraC family transcriptional regulator ligand-binding domain-containing protein [Planctomycetota bacterium]